MLSHCNAGVESVACPAATGQHLVPAANLPAIIILNNTYKSLSCLTTSQTSSHARQTSKLANWRAGKLEEVGKAWEELEGTLL